MGIGGGGVMTSDQRAPLIIARLMENLLPDSGSAPKSRNDDGKEFCVLFGRHVTCRCGVAEPLCVAHLAPVSAIGTEARLH